MNSAIDPGPKIPRHPHDDYTAEMAEIRRAFLRERTSAALSNVGRFSLDPASVRGNVENFIGAAQVPIGVAGPLRIEGEHARGSFYVPLATTEGALVASYNRGMRLLTECGGVKTTIVEQHMQRSPVFLFEDAQQAREFGVWVQLRFDAIKQVADATTESGKLVGIEQHAVGPMRHLRFNYTTGDAAGQNMTSKATLAACQWISDSYPGGARFLLSGNMETDKKHSRLNLLLTRGKRVVAEAVVRREVLQRIMGIDTAEAFALRQVSNVGAFVSGSSGNGLHAANALTALFIACGQDVACVSESHAAVVYTQLLPEGDYYWSVTLPSLIVGTYGGGTALATQRECLELLGCYGAGTASRFAEICAATVLAGETSLAGAAIHGDWVGAHDRLGRNRK